MCSPQSRADGCMFLRVTFYILYSLKSWCSYLLDPAKQSYRLYDAWAFPTPTLVLCRPMVKDAITLQGVFPISYANTACLPYRMWPGSRDGGPFLLSLDMLDKEEHVERGRRVHCSHFKRLLEYRRGMKGQSLSKEGAGWTGTEQSLLWEQGTFLQQGANL